MRHLQPVDSLPSGLALLEGVDSCDREQVLDCLGASYVTYDEGDVVAEAARTAGPVAYLTEGRVYGCVYDEEGNRSILHVFVPGQALSYGGAFGFNTLVDMTAVARRGCRLLVFDLAVPSSPHLRRCIDIIRANLAQTVAAFVDARGFASMLMESVRRETGICATAGIGTNLFLAKLALDITAKHVDDHIGYLDEEEFRRTVWHHRPITDVWNIGPGIARRLEKYGVHDLFGICWLDEQVLYREFGANAALLIDHARGVEPCTIQEIHDFVPQSSSIANGQILAEGYDRRDAHRVLREMVEESVFDLVDRRLVTGHISLSVGYQKSDGPHGGALRAAYARRPWELRTGGSRKLPYLTSSFRKIADHFDNLYEETTLSGTPVKRIQIGLGGLEPELKATPDLFAAERDERERRTQRAVLAINKRFGKNCLLRGSSLLPHSTVRERNGLIGGHRA